MLPNQDSLLSLSLTSKKSIKIEIEVKRLHVGFIGNRNRDKNGCNYNCPVENGDVCGILIIFAPESSVPT